MSATLEKAIEILQLPVSPNIKIDFLSGLIKDKTTFTALTIVAASSTFKSTHFNVLKERLSVTNTPASASTALKQCVRILTEPQKLHKVSEKGFTLLSYIMNPQALGLSRLKISKLLDGHNIMLTPISAAGYLGLSPEAVGLAPKKELKYCYCCGRQLTMLATEKLCTSCVKELSSLAEYRILPMKIPLSATNIKHYIPHDENVKTYEGSLGDAEPYSFYKHGNEIIIEYKKEAFYQPSLPYELYAEPIFLTST